MPHKKTKRAFKYAWAQKAGLEVLIYKTWMTQTNASPVMWKKILQDWKAGKISLSIDVVTDFVPKKEKK